MSTTKHETVDPVCGMTVDTNDARRGEYEGQSCFFCSEHCQQKFNDNPVGRCWFAEPNRFVRGT